MRRATEYYRNSHNIPVLAAMTVVFSFLNSGERSEKAMISVGHTNVKSFG